MVDSKVTDRLQLLCSVVPMLDQAILAKVGSVVLKWVVVGGSVVPEITIVFK